MVEPDPNGLLDGVLITGGTRATPDYTVFVSRVYTGSALDIDVHLRDLIKKLHSVRDAIRVDHHVQVRLDRRT